MNARKQALEKLSDPEYVRKFLESQETPVSLEPISGNWVHCREAREIVANAAKCSLQEAEQVICRRALCWIPLRVAAWGRREEPHDYIDRIEFFAGKEANNSHFSEHPLPRAWEEIRTVFENIAMHEPILVPNGVRYAHWATGDFHVTIEKDFSNVTLELIGLHLDRPALERSLGLPVAAAPISRSPISDELVVEWIGNCGIENGKLAWAEIKRQLGADCPKKTEQFERVWRSVKGNRGRGRPPRKTSKIP